MAKFPAPPPPRPAEMALLMAHHNDHPGKNDNSSTRSSPYFQVPPQFPPETYNYLIHALLSLQGSSSHPNYSYPWPPAFTPPITSPCSLSSPYPMPYPPRAEPQSAGSSQHASSSTAFPTTASTTQDLEGSEDSVSTAEDKRRRNTAASARFRVKKRLKTFSLERTVADLTGRSEELEREAADLRRENAWLKEIVLLKGRNLATLHVGSHTLAPGNPHDDDDDDDEPESQSSVNRRDKGKDREF